MKRLFLLLAIAGVMVACSGEDKKSEEQRSKTAFDYYVEWITASAEGNQEAFNVAYEAHEKATKDMSHDELRRLYEDVNRWNVQNSDIATKGTTNLIRMKNEYRKSK